MLNALAMPIIWICSDNITVGNLIFVTAKYVWNVELNLTLICGTETGKWPTCLLIADNEEYAITRERTIIFTLYFHNYYTHMLVYIEKQ